MLLQWAILCRPLKGVHHHLHWLKWSWQHEARLLSKYYWQHEARLLSKCDLFQFLSCHFFIWGVVDVDHLYCPLGEHFSLHHVLLQIKQDYHHHWTRHGPICSTTSSFLSVDSRRPATNAIQPSHANARIRPEPVKLCSRPTELPATTFYPESLEWMNQESDI